MANRFDILQEADVAAAGSRSSGRRRRANNGAGSSGTPSPESSGKSSFYSTEQTFSRHRENPASPPHQQNPPSPSNQPERHSGHSILWVAPANRAHHLYMAMFVLTSVYTIYAYVKDALTTEGALAERLSAFGALAYTSGFISVVMTTFDFGSDLVLHLATISAVTGLFGLTVATLLGVGHLSDSARKMLIRVGLFVAALLLGVEYRRGLSRIFLQRREQHDRGAPRGGEVGDVETGSVSSRRAGETE